MGVNQFLAAVSRRMAPLMTRLASARNPDSTTDAELVDGNASTPADRAATERRQHERRRFVDDAAYFKFLIERATGVSASLPPT